MVHGGIILAVAASEGRLASLCGHGTEALVLRGCHLLSRGARLDSTVATIEAHPIAGVAYHGAVDICVVDGGCIHIEDGGVIAEAISIPASTVEAVAVISIVVVNAAIKADFGRPIAFVIHIASFIPCPVSGGPEQAGLGGRNPGSGNPVVAVVSPGPVARRPQIVRLGANRLHIVGQLRGSDGDGYSDLGKGDAGHDKKRSDQKGISKPFDRFHRASFGPHFLNSTAAIVLGRWGPYSVSSD